jgi:hypothetical protein
MSELLSEDRLERAREAMLRRLARRQGLSVTRSRSRTPEAYQYGRYFIVSDQNWLLTSESGMTLDEVEEWLSAEE